MVKIHFILRSSNERTSNALYESLVNNEFFEEKNVSVLIEKPFWKTLEKSIELAGQIETEYFGLIDGDVLITQESLRYLYNYTQQNLLHERFGGIQFNTLNYLFGGPRSGGLHLYRRGFLLKGRNFIGDIKFNDRPETKLKELLMQANKKEWKFSNYLIGLEDYFQSYKDYFRKGYIFGIKHSLAFDYFGRLWLSDSYKESGFKAALFGLIEGHKQKRETEYSSEDKYVNLAWSKYKDIFCKCKEEKIIKPEQVIGNWDPSSLYLKQYHRKISKNKLPKVQFNYIYLMRKLFQRFI